jgi:hypothetical protein
MTEAKYIAGNVRAVCPGCGGALSTFEYRGGGRGEYGTVVQQVDGSRRNVYVLMSCGGCGRGGLATIYDPIGRQIDGMLIEFYPPAIDRATLPTTVPPGLSGDFREAEICASVGAWRGASALLRSVLEKTLIANGYTKGSLSARIDEAAADGVITAARQRRAHEDIRVLGNDVLHDEWREVTGSEYEAAHLYTQRILEDLYDLRGEVEQVLTSAGRLKKP